MHHDYLSPFEQALAGIVAKAVLALIALVIAAAVWFGTARAQYDPWVDHLHSQSGFLCCANNDGRRLDDPEWRVVGDAYEVLFTEGWVKVPPEAQVNDRNQDGIARVWSYMDLDQNGVGTRQIRCFLPGAFS